LNRFRKVGASCAALGTVLAPIAARAQATGTTACTQANAEGFGAVQAQTSNVFQQFANFVAAGPVKYGLIIGAIAMLVAVVMDNGQLPQVVKIIVTILAVVILIITIIAWIIAQPLCVNG
jgi:tetrahydromethanopterin S-methyltransferase subunit E